MGIKNSFTKIKRVHIQVFTRQFAILLEANLSANTALEILAEAQNNVKFKNILLDISQKLRVGESLSKSFAAYPKVFNGFYCGILEAGSQSAKLPDMLKNLVQFQQNSTNLESKIKKALYYPVFVLLFGFLVSGFLLVKVIPQFEILFFNFGANLPWITYKALQISRFVQHNYQLIVFLVALIILAINLLGKYSLNAKASLAYFVFKLPMLGKLIKLSLITKMTKTLALSIDANMRMDKSLLVLSFAIDNLYFKQKILAIRQKVILGKNLSTALSEDNFFPTILVQLIATGEQTAQIEKLLNQAGELYQLEVQNYIDKITSLIEPIVMLMLGLIIGALVVAIYMPIFMLNSAIGG